MSPQLALTLWSYRREILKVAGVIVVLLLVVGAAIAGAFVAGVPLVPDHLIPIYQQEAKDLTAPDGEPVSGLDWRWLVVIDAIRYRQDFNQVNEGTIHDLAGRFVKRIHHEGGKPCAKGDPHCSCSIVTDPGTGQPVEICVIEAYDTYELYTPEEVMDQLLFSTEQKEQALAMIQVDQIGGPGTCFDFTPNPASRYLWPIDGPITSCFGMRLDPVEGDSHMHYGIDVSADAGTPVPAAHAGRVNTAYWSGNYGNLIILVGDDMTTWYAHLSGYAVSVGDYVEKGDIIGYVGSTGKSTGSHLHLETRPLGGDPVDPVTVYQ